MAEEHSPDQPQDDQTLWDRFRGGDDAAFATLIERHTPDLHDYIMCLCGHEPTALRLLTRLWTRACAYAGPIGPYGEVRTWLFALATAMHDDPTQMESMGLMALFEAPAPEDAASPAVPAEVRALRLRQRLPLILTARFGFDLDAVGMICRGTHRTAVRALRAALRKLCGGQAVSAAEACAAAKVLRDGAAESAEEVLSDVLRETCQGLRAELTEHPRQEPDADFVPRLTDEISAATGLRGAMPRQELLPRPGEHLWLKRAAGVAAVLIAIVVLNVLVFRFVVTPPDPGERAAEVQWTAGEVKVQYGRAEMPLPLPGPGPLYAGHVISTAADSRAAMAAPPDVRLLLAGNGGLGFGGPGELALGGGRLLVDSRGTGAEVNVQSPNGIARLRPGRFVLTVTNYRFEVVVLEGEAQLRALMEDVAPAVASRSIASNHIGVCFGGREVHDPLPIRPRLWEACFGLLGEPQSDLERPVNGNEIPEIMPNAPAEEQEPTERLTASVRAAAGVALIDGPEEAPRATRLTPASIARTALRRFEALPTQTLILPLPTAPTERLSVTVLVDADTDVRSPTHVLHRGPLRGAGKWRSRHLTGSDVQLMRPLQVHLVNHTPQGLVASEGERFVCAISVCEQDPLTDEIEAPHRFVLIADASAGATGAVRTQIIRTVEELLVRLPQPASVGLMASGARAATFGKELRKLDETSAEQILAGLWQLSPAGKAQPAAVVQQIEAAEHQENTLFTVFLVGRATREEAARLDAAIHSLTPRLRLAAAVTDPEFSPGRPLRHVLPIAADSPGLLAERVLNRLLSRHYTDVQVTLKAGAEVVHELRRPHLVEGEPLIVAGGGKSPTSAVVSARYDGRRREWTIAMEPLDGKWTQPLGKLIEAEQP